MKDADFIISARWVLTVDEDNTVLRDHSVVVNKGKILDILPSQTASETYRARHIKRDNHILMPGLVNAHTHMSMNLLRGYADDLPLMQWLEQHIWPAESKWVSEEFVADGTRLAIAESLLGGITCFNDMYFFPEVSARIASSAGIRAVIGLIILDFPTVYANSAEDYLRKALSVRDELRGDPLVSVTLAPHAPYTVSRESLDKVYTLSSELDIPVHIHVHETEDEVSRFTQQNGVTPLQQLHAQGLTNPQLIAVHMTQLTEQDIALAAQTGLHIAHCPESNMKLASGTCPVNKLLQAGVNVCLGTDGAASNNDLDMFGEMKSAALLGKLASADASAVSAPQALRMATINGATALGLQEVTGSLEPGKAADFITLDTTSLSMTPIYDPVSHVVYSASRDNVSDVWVAGKQLLKQRQLLTLKQQEIFNSTQHWQDKIQSS